MTRRAPPRKDENTMRLGNLSRLIRFGLAACWLAGTATAAAWQGSGTVLREGKIAWSSGGFGGVLDNDDMFGDALAALGDVDGDGVEDLAVGAWQDDDGSTNRGAVWIVFLNPDGSVRGEQKISSGSGGFLGALDTFDRFGASIAALDDLDGDGVGELAVGADLDDDGGTNRGAVWILFLDATGRVKLEQKVSQTSGGFGGVLVDGDRFGHALAVVGDLDGDGVDELAVGADQDDDGGANQGAVWILFMNPDGSVRGEQKISASAGNFSGALDDDDRFGHALAALGDLDGDGVADLAVGADQDDDGGSACGAVWVLRLRPDGTVKSHAKLGAGLGLVLDSFDRFGGALAAPGDVNGDGVVDLAIGATGDDDGGIGFGATWILFLDSLGGVSGWTKISAASGGFTGPLGLNHEFGVSLAALHDLDGDGMLDLAVGADRDDEGGRDRGATWILFLESAQATVENAPPTVVCSGGGVYEAGVESVSLGGVVSDLDGDELSYSWREDGVVFAQGWVETPAGGAPADLPGVELTTGGGAAHLGLGEHVLVLRVDDGVNEPVECQARVEVIDTRAPDLEVWCDVEELWPPRHQLVTVVVKVSTQDAAGGPVELAARVSSSDDAAPEGRHGGGFWREFRGWQWIRGRWSGPDYTEPRIDPEAGTIEVELRAERYGYRDRVYTIDVWATDGEGNPAQGAVEIVVPRRGPGGH